jgi:hypothetical protein
MRTSEEQRDELGTLAETAKGPWFLREPAAASDPDVCPADICEYEVCDRFEYDAGEGNVQDGESTIAEGLHEADAAYIVAAHPPAIIDLLADLAEVTRERDEARAALREVADQLWSRNNRETCIGCPAEGALCDELNVHGNCINTIVAAAYTSTGGTVPDAQE